MTQPHSTYRHSPLAKKLLTKIAFKLGVTKTAVLELLIRDKASQMGLLK